MMGLRTGRPQISQDRLRDQLRYADRKKKQKWLQQHPCGAKYKRLSPWQQMCGARFIV